MCRSAVYVYGHLQSTGENILLTSERNNGTRTLAYLLNFLVSEIFRLHLEDSLFYGFMQNVAGDSILLL